MAPLLDRIRAHLDPAAQPDLASMERTLTDGYAHALALEGERWRIERRIGEVAASLEHDDGDGKTAELSSLSRRLTTASGELARLRELLGRLRSRASSSRS